MTIHTFKGLLWKALAIAILTGPVSAEEPTARDKSRSFTIAYVNDIHAQLEPHPELFWSGKAEEHVQNVGGLARIASAVKALRVERPGQVVFVDGGDTIQGSGPAAWSEGRVVVKPMGSIGLDIAIPGNWAVTYGAEALKERAAELNYPLIAANILVDNGPETLFPSHQIREINGVKVGFIGLTDPDIPTRQPPFMSEGLSFAGDSVIQPLVDKIRASGQVDVVVLVTHIGLNKAVGLSERLHGVDVILSADSHERTYEPIKRGQTWVVEAGAFGSFLGVLEVTVDESGAVVKRDWQLEELRPESYPEDPAVKALVEEALAPYRERTERVIGQTSEWLERYDVLNASIDRVVSNAIREAAKTDVALTNGYRFAPPLAPGPITEGDLWNWLPMSLPLKAGKAKGSQLSSYWEKELDNVFSPDPLKQFGGWLPRPSNMGVLFDSASAPGHRLKALTIGARPVEPDKVYSIASGSYKGAPVDHVHRVGQCTETHQLDMDVHQAVRSYLGHHLSVNFAGSTPAVRSVAGPSVLRSQSYHLKGDSHDES